MANHACDRDSRDGVGAVSFGVADWLGFAATPSFALMALLAAAYDASPIGGMPPMDLPMGAFHAAPWVKLILRRGILAT